MASQRHKLLVQNVTVRGEIVAEGVMSPAYLIQLYEEGTPEAFGTKEADGAIEVPMGPAGGPLSGSSLAGPIPEGLTPPPEPEETWPVLSSIEPATAELNSPDFELHCIGSNFTEESIIMFAGQPEPIVFVSSGDISTIVKPSLPWGPATLPVYVQNADGSTSTELSFVFTEAPAADEVKTTKRRRKTDE